MNVPLRNAIRTFLKDWRDDVPSQWRSVLQGVEPAFDNVQEGLLLREDEKEVIYPGRRASPLPNAPQGAHIFKSLERLDPDDVVAVVIGQDPYTHIDQATGRAFEQGDLTQWAGGSSKVTTSMRRILQAASHQRKGMVEYLVAGGWARVQSDLASGALDFKKPREQFDLWEDAGVLWLNAALTISRYVPGGGPEQKFGHLPLWEPVIRQIILHLARRNGKRVVFLTWGVFAQRLLKSTGVHSEPAWKVTATNADRPHPATVGFLKLPNPFSAANTALTGLGGAPIVW